MESCVSRRIGVLLLPLGLLVAGCDLSLGHLTARATDEWSRSYPLEAGGEIRIVNTNGKIEIEGTEGSTVEVKAEKIARGATDAAARELLPRIVIKEDIKPDRVSLETERMSGIMIGAAFEVRYHVRAPKNAVVNITNTNGQVALSASLSRTLAYRPAPETRQAQQYHPAPQERSQQQSRPMPESHPAPQHQQVPEARPQQSRPMPESRPAPHPQQQSRPMPESHPMPQHNAPEAHQAPQQNHKPDQKPH